MAAAHIAGLAAYLLAIDSSLTPCFVSGALSFFATKNAITLSAAATIAETPNKLAFNGIE
jgi:hypothetical protein